MLRSLYVMYSKALASETLTKVHKNDIALRFTFERTMSNFPSKHFSYQVMQFMVAFFLGRLKMLTALLQNASSLELPFGHYISTNCQGYSKKNTNTICLSPARKLNIKEAKNYNSFDIFTIRKLPYYQKYVNQTYIAFCGPTNSQQSEIVLT